MSSHIVSIGEALVDMIEISDDTQPTYMAAWGGSPFNVAVGARRLGCNVEFAGSFAGDALGDRMRHFLQAEGIGTDLSNVVSHCNTTIAMTSFVDAEPQYAFYASPASYGFLPPAISSREIIRTARVVHTGSLAMLEDLTFDSARAALSATDGVCTFDPNVRASMVSDWDDYRGRLGQMIGLADFLKFSAEDIAAAYPGQSEESIALAALNGRTQAVLITRAGEAASLYTGSQVGEVKPWVALGVQDTTGGGDATMASIVQQIATKGLPESHNDWREVVEQAFVVAGIVCSRRGGAIAMPTQDEVRHELGLLP